MTTGAFVIGDGLCGAVRLRVAGPLPAPIACRCDQCRRRSKHFAASTTAQWVAVTVTGEVRWCDWKSGVRSGFFSDLWAQLFGERTAEPAISIEVRDFDRAAGLQPAGRIFTAGKGDYHDIADGLPTASRDRGHFA